VAFTPCRCLVTGAAGFIGSHLCERLISLGCDVIGVDSFTDYYPRSIKEANLASLSSHHQFELIEGDLLQADLMSLVASVAVIFHQAGQPGVRASWGRSFEPYVRSNILATQALLEAACANRNLTRFVYASSSSVYGDVQALPAREDTIPRPVSPYGVTKLAAEHLCLLYAKLGVPTVSLRYFTVYGPRQRPDMAFHRFICALTNGSELTINGDGEQTRDFTFVDDIVDANLSAVEAHTDVVAGNVYNLGGGARVTVNHVVHTLETILGRSARLRYDPVRPGEARHTYADTSAARTDLGFVPRHSLEDGLKAEANWLTGTLDT
jgi:nucleoside-diphosphate-sugar epimerase